MWPGGGRGSGWPCTDLLGAAGQWYGESMRAAVSTTCRGAVVRRINEEQHGVLTRADLISFACVAFAIVSAALYTSGICRTRLVGAILAITASISVVSIGSWVLLSITEPGLVSVATWHYACVVIAGTFAFLGGWFLKSRGRPMLLCGIQGLMCLSATLMVLLWGSFVSVRFQRFERLPDDALGIIFVDYQSASVKYVSDDKIVPIATVASTLLSSSASTIQRVRANETQVLWEDARLGTMFTGAWDNDVNTPAVTVPLDHAVSEVPDLRASERYGYIIRMPNKQVIKRAFDSPFFLVSWKNNRLIASRGVWLGDGCFAVQMGHAEHAFILLVPVDGEPSVIGPGTAPIGVSRTPDRLQ